MYKCLAGMAAAAVVTTVATVAASSPANAFAVRHAPGVAQDQATVEQVWHRGRPHRRYYRHGYRGHRYYYGGGPYYYGGPYAYGAPYPYYRRHYGYGPRPFVGIGIGPFGFGVW
jgi:hypothetical protein